LRSVLLGHDQAVRTVQFLPDSEHLITRSDDGTARIWTLVSNNEVWPPQRLNGHVVRDFIRKGAVWLVAYIDNSVVVWDNTHSATIATLRGPSPTRVWGPASRAFIDAEGTRLIAVINPAVARFDIENRTAWVWDLSTGKELSHIR